MASRNTSSNARQNVQRSNRDSARWIAGLLLLCVGIFVAAAVFFSYFCWAEDQSVLQKSAEDRELLGSEIENPCGPLGARLGRMLVDNSFGVFGILIPVMLILVGVRIIRQRSLRLNQSVLSLFLIMILGSLTFGFLLGANWSLCSSTGWGGAFGNLLASRHPFGDDASIGMLPGAIGSLGTLILLVGGWILTGVFINRNFINKVNEAGNVLMDRSEKIVDTVRSKVAHARSGADSEADDADEPESNGAEDSVHPVHPAAGHDRAADGGREGLSGREARAASATVRDAAGRDGREIRDSRESREMRDGRDIRDGREADLRGAGQRGLDARGGAVRDGSDLRNPDERTGLRGSTADSGVRSAEMRESAVRGSGLRDGGIRADAAGGAAAQPAAAGAELRRAVRPEEGAETAAREESPFIELTPDGRPIEETEPKTSETAQNEDFVEVDLSRPGGRVVMGRGGLVELEPASPRSAARRSAGADEPFIEITVGDEESHAADLQELPVEPAASVRRAPTEPFEELDAGRGAEPWEAPGIGGSEAEPFEELQHGAHDAGMRPDDAASGETEPVAAGGAWTEPSHGHAAPAEGVVVTVEAHEARMVDAKKISTESYDPLKDLVNYRMPPVSLLEDYISDIEVSDEEIFDNKTRIEETLKNFGIPIQRIRATVGPTVTLYEIVQAQGVKISKIQGLQNDIAQSLKAESGIRIIAPIPGRGTIGIEVPNRHKQIVSMFSAIRSLRFQESKAELPVVIGRTIQNENYVFDLTKMPHLLVAGATGQGKSVGLNAIITSLLYRKHPAQLKFVMIDPKMVEFSLYARVERHFLAKMQSEDEAIVTDPKKAVYTLNALCTEMDIRLELCKKAGVRNIAEYNAKFVARQLNPMNGHRYLPYIVVVIDEFADLIMTAKEVEIPVTRLAQKARAIGIHLIIATQRPSVDVITGKIKANFPARIAFRVMQMTDSRTIIDRPGADQLIGRGDMLISKDGELTRIQCALVETKEVERIVDYISKQQGYTEAYALPDYTPESEGGAQMGSEESSAPVKYDSLFAEIARDAVASGQISTSMIQRNYEVGFNRAGRIMMQLERAGIVGRQQGAKPRDILFYDLPSLEAKLQDLGVS